MAKLTDGITGTYRMTREQMEAFAAKSNSVRDSGGWTTLRWQVIDTGDGPKLEERDTTWQRPWRPTPSEKASVQAEAESFADRFPWLTMKQYGELVERYGNNIPDRFTVEPPPLKKRVLLRRDEFDRIVSERSLALSHMLDLGVIYRTAEGFACHPECQARTPSRQLESNPA